jgi:hypothetical protein
VVRQSESSFLAVYLGVFKTLSQDGTAWHANVTYHF